MKRRLPAVAGALGILGSLACSIAMVLALLGLLGAGVAAGAASSGDMASMSSSPALARHNSSLPAPLVTILFYLFHAGPAILILSIAAIGLAVGLRRRIVTLVPVTVAGLVLYWGMYLQASRVVMYLAVGVGLAALVAAYLWSMRTTPDKGPRAN